MKQTINFQMTIIKHKLQAVSFLLFIVRKSYLHKQLLV